MPNVSVQGVGIATQTPASRSLGIAVAYPLLTVFVIVPSFSILVSTTSPGWR